jgi:RHS repeat-associated protein
VKNNLAETRHYFFSQGWQGLEERTGFSTNADRQFVYGLRYTDNLILRDRNTTGASERLFAVQDANWNVTALIDTTGEVQERYRYSGYGIPTFLTPNFSLLASSHFGWEMLFAGYRWDAETGLYQVRTRWLSAKLGAWLERDPLGLASGVNLYRYASNQPIIRTDWSGLDVLGLLGFFGMNPAAGAVAVFVLIAVIIIGFAFVAIWQNQWGMRFQLPLGARPEEACRPEARPQIQPERQPRLPPVPVGIDILPPPPNENERESCEQLYTRTLIPPCSGVPRRVPDLLNSGVTPNQACRHCNTGCNNCRQFNGEAADPPREYFGPLGQMHYDCGPNGRPVPRGPGYYSAICGSCCVESPGGARVIRACSCGFARS